MGEQLAKLEAYVAHTAFERGASFAAVLIGNKFEIGHRSDVEHRSDCLFLLALVCDTGCYSLKGRNIGLAQFEVAGGLALYDLDREPWEVAGFALFLRHQQDHRSRRRCRACKGNAPPSRQ